VIRLTLFLLLCAVWRAPAQDFKELEKKVTDFSLANGMRFLVVERHDTPAVSFVTRVAAGTANDPSGATGLARFFERLVLQGTDTIGTRDASAEKRALASVEEVLDRVDAERAKGRQADDVKLLSLQYDLAKAMSVARSFAAPDEFRRIFDESNASGLASSVSADSSQFQLTLPSNRAELWFFLESQRLFRPVFRDFYIQREQAASDYRARVERNGQAKLLQTLAAAAFTAHPYRNPSDGWPGGVAGLRQADAREFLGRYYVPGNVTIAIAGDIRPEEAKRLAERYFGSIPAAPLPPPIRTQEPAQTGPRTVILESSLETLLAIGFKRPDEFAPDDPVLEVTRAILAAGRSSLLAKELIETRRTASTLRAISAYPGGRSPSLFAIVVAAAPGHTAEENEQAIAAVLNRLQTGEVDEATLLRGKLQTCARLFRQLSDNAAIASALAAYASEYGDWRKLFGAAEAYRKVTAGQVQVAAVRYFLPSRQTTVRMTQPPPVRQEAAKGAGN
jgi:predicted Zn-dependent peptidase